MTEHQVVVVFDATAKDLLTAGVQVADFLNRNKDQWPTDHIESWWMPEEPLRTEVDGNDNAPGRLVFDTDEGDVRQIASDVEAGLWDNAGQFTCAEANAFARLLRLGGRDGGAQQFLESHSLSDDDSDDPEHVQIRAALARDSSGGFSITGPAVSS